MRKIVGFTLVELLVVMAIMSILSVITFGQFQNAQKRARDVQRKSDLSAIYKAVFFYFTDYGKVPDISDMAPNNIDINLRIKNKLEFTRDGYFYIQKFPNESVVGLNQYCYLPSQDNKGFGIFSVLESKGDSECKKYIPQNGACGGASGYNFALLSSNIKLSNLSYKIPGETPVAGMVESNEACL